MWPRLRCRDQSVRAGPGFMNTSQCVMPDWPLTWPNSGAAGASARTSPTFTWVSFHLNTSTPSGARTRQHSANPWRRSSRQSVPSFPYLAASQLRGPARTMLCELNAFRSDDGLAQLSSENYSLAHPVKPPASDAAARLSTHLSQDPIDLLERKAEQGWALALTAPTIFIPVFREVL